VGQLKEKINQLLKDVDNSYNMALIKLPKAVRQVVWLEHCSESAHTHARTHTHISSKNISAGLNNRNVVEAV